MRYYNLLFLPTTLRAFSPSSLSRITLSSREISSSLLSFASSSTTTSTIPRNKQFRRKTTTTTVMSFSKTSCNNENNIMETEVLDDEEETVNNNTTSSYQKTFYGGDFAGHIATFSSTTGTLLPVPEYILPESLIEWGQIPSSFELLTSEDIMNNNGDGDGDGDNNNNNDDEHSNMMVLNRVGIRVVPEVGCGVDNLDTMVKNENLNLSPSPSSSISTSSSFHMNSILNLSTFVQSCNTDEEMKEHTMETMFLHTRIEDEEQVYTRRIRVNLTIQQKSSSSSTTAASTVEFKQRQPIEIISERKTSNTSTKGGYAKGGGLDGRTVMTLIGRKNSNKPFSDDVNSIISLKELNGEWDIQNKDDGNNNNDDDDDDESSMVVYDDEFWNGDNNDNCRKTFSLPGNVLVRFDEKNNNSDESNFPWMVEVSIVDKDNEQMKRRVVQMMIQEDGTSSVSSWVEVKRK